VYVEGALDTRKTRIGRHDEKETCMGRGATAAVGLLMAFAGVIALLFVLWLFGII
jgi:hypothetical protein